MTRHIDDDLLQDLQEGLLPAEEEERVRAHLGECPQCREELEALSDLLAELGGLPQEATPSRDLWPQVAWRIEGDSAFDHRPEPAASKGEGETSVRGKGGRRRVSLPAWQLLAASITLALISGGTVWVYLSGGDQASEPVAATSPSLALPAGWNETFGQYDAAEADLQAVLELGREVLDPETIRILEENLLTIDQAISQAREALVRDPGSRILNRLLAESLRRKMDLLRHAALAVYANT